VAECCEHGDELSCYVKVEEFLTVFAPTALSRWTVLRAI
jgi:hypothetical protein